MKHPHYLIEAMPDSPRDAVRPEARFEPADNMPHAGKRFGYMQAEALGVEFADDKDVHKVAEAKVLRVSTATVVV